MYFNVYKCFALFITLLGKYLLPITTNTVQTFIHKFMEKSNSQQSNNNLKIYKKTVFTHLTYIQNVSNMFSWKRLINFIPIYSSPQYVYAFFFNRSVDTIKCIPTYYKIYIYFSYIQQN
jgi:hypothetical protein